MIVQENINQGEVIGLDRDTTLKMTIDRSSDKILMMVLSQNLYSDGIGSLIREYTTNALDAQREAGNNNPIKVKLVKENGKFVFIVQDEGVGLSPDRIENVFSKYLSSTKRNDENQMGWYGLGSKSALSYVDSFHVISRYDGKEYDFLMLKGEESTELSLLDINDTTEHNGVQIKVYLNDEDDYEVFLDKMKNQLCYFEGVFIETEYNDIEPDYKIIKADDWKFSELNSDQYMHLSLDNVYYPLDFEKLGIDRIKMPIGINLSLKDNIVPTPNRENILYNAHVKKLILDKISKIATYFVNKWNEFAPNVNTLEEGRKYKDNYGVISLYNETDVFGNEKMITVKVDKKLEMLTDVKMKSVSLSLFPNLSIDSLRDNEDTFLNEYKMYSEFEYGRYKSRYGKKGEPDNYRNLHPNHLTSGTVLLLKPEEQLSKSQIDYLKWIGKTVYVVRKQHTTRLGKFSKYGSYGKNVYRGLLHLEKKPKSQWRNLIKEYQDFIKLNYLDKFVGIDSIIPTQEFFDYKESQKKERKKVVYNTKEEITIGRISFSNRAKKNFIITSKEIYNLTDLHTLPGMYYYFHENDIDKIMKTYNVSKLLNNIQLIALSDRNYNKILKQKPIHNWVSYDKFFDTKNKRLSTILTGILLRDIWHRELDRDSINDNTQLVDKKAYDKYYKIYDKIKHSYNTLDSDVSFFCMKLYIENNWLDQDLITPFKEVFTDVKKFDFLNVLNHSHSDKKLLKKFSLTLYLSQLKEEKQKGVISYEKYDMDSIINKRLETYTKKEEEEEESIEEEVIVTDELEDTVDELEEVEDDYNF